MNPNNGDGRQFPTTSAPTTTAGVTTVTTVAEIHAEPTFSGVNTLDLGSETVRNALAFKSPSSSDDSVQDDEAIKPEDAAMLAAFSKDKEKGSEDILKQILRSQADIPTTAARMEIQESANAAIAPAPAPAVADTKTETPACSHAIIPDPTDGNESEDPSQLVEPTLNDSADSTPTGSIRSIGSLVCRICHNSENPEKLVSPCLCKGSLTYVHIHCLERWISTSRNTTCELCHFKYNTVQTLRYTCVQSLRMWYSRSMSRRALQEDCQMFSLLTLVAFGIIGTLLVGIQYYFMHGYTFGVSRLWTKGWLLFFLFTTLLVYFVNIYMIVRSQLTPWYRWWQSARDIKLILENRRPFRVESPLKPKVHARFTSSRFMTAPGSATRLPPTPQPEQPSQSAQPSQPEAINPSGSHVPITTQLHGCSGPNLHSPDSKPIGSAKFGDLEAYRRLRRFDSFEIGDLDEVVVLGSVQLAINDLVDLEKC